MADDTVKEFRGNIEVADLPERVDSGIGATGDDEPWRSSQRA
jgi:hypothetical protein